MPAIELPGVRVTLGTPRVVTEGVGYCWFPNLLRFATGELLLTHSLVGDSNENMVQAHAALISADEGRSWSHPYDVIGFSGSGGDVRISRPDGSIVGPSYAVRPDPPEQWRRFVAHYYRFEAGGRRYTVEPWAATIEGLPRDLAPEPLWSRTWWARICLFGDAVEVEAGRYVTTCSLRYVGDERDSTVALVSEDAGRAWRYLATIAEADAIPDATEGFDEPCMARLASGELLCISRVGSGADQPLARTYSRDGGRSWSPIDRLPAYSVAPSLCRLQDGLLALATGRPGIFLWLSSDPRGAAWEPIDILSHHNAALDERHRIRAGRDGSDGVDPYQTTAYTALLEVAPGRLMMVYDRVPFGWKPVPIDSEERSRIYLMEIGVEPR